MARFQEQLVVVAVLGLALPGCVTTPLSARYRDVVVTSSEPPAKCRKIERVSVYAMGNGVPEIQAVTDQKGGNVVVIDSSIAEQGLPGSTPGFQQHIVGRAFACPDDVVKASRPDAGKTDAGK